MKMVDLTSPRSTALFENLTVAVPRYYRTFMTFDVVLPHWHVHKSRGYS